MWDFEKSSALQSRGQQQKDGFDTPVELKLLLKQPPSASVSAMKLRRPKQAQRLIKMEKGKENVEEKMVRGH